MAVENTNFIGGLDPATPTGTDPKSQGDDQFRLIKRVLRQCFAGFPGEILIAGSEAQGSTPNDFLVTVSPAPLSYATNALLMFRAVHANTGASTIRVGGLSVKMLLTPEGTALRKNAIIANTWCLAVFDGTNFRLLAGNSQAIYDYANQLAFSTALPDQEGNAGKLLTTDGSTADWKDVDIVFGFQQTGDGAIERTFQNKMRDVASLNDFGLRLDGIQDDTVALINAIKSGRRLDLGEGGTARITSSIDLPIVGALDWQGSLRVLFDPPTNQAFAIRLTFPGGGRRVIKGLTIDANRKTATALHCLNDTDSFEQMDFEVAAVNTYRADKTFANDSAIWIRGKWAGRIKPTAKNIALAAAAGTSGIAGACALLINATSNARSPGVVLVDRPDIDKVYCENSAYVLDQDGMRLYAAEDNPSDLRPYETKFVVDGGRIRNCTTRSIKVQSDFSLVRAVEFVREAGLDGWNPATTTTPEIDFQVGGGQVIGCSALYKGAVPASVALFNNPSTEAKSVPYGSMSGMQISVSNATLDSVVRMASRNANVPNYVVASDIQVTGPINSVADVRLLTGTNNSIIGLKGVICAPILGLFQTVGGAFNGGKAFASHCFNTGATLAQVFNQGSSTHKLEISLTQCYGWAQSRRVTNATPGDAFRVTTIAPAGAETSGQERWGGALLNPEELFILPLSAYNGIAATVKLGVGGGRDDQAQFAVDINGTTKHYGANWNGGTTSEPASGVYRIWIQDGAVAIRHYASTARQITYKIFG